MAHREGELLGHYRLLRLIGRGGMGEVYLAEDEHHAENTAPRQVAIKVVPISDTTLSTDADALRILREGRFLVELHHPHILPVYHDGIRDDLLFLVMPYVPDGSLADAIHARLGLRLDLPVALERVVDYIGQIAEALQYTHDRHIVHRDVKPGNVLIEVRPDGHWHLFLADFGIARNVDTTSHESGWHGTVAYMAPEQFRGEMSPAADQYALAVLAFQLLSGQVPFAMVPPAVRTLNPAVPMPTETVLLKGLAVRPEERFGSVSDFASALRASAIETATTQPVTRDMPHPSLGLMPQVNPPMMSAPISAAPSQPYKSEPEDAMEAAPSNRSPSGDLWQQVRQALSPRGASSRRRQGHASPTSRFRWVRGRRYLASSDIIVPVDATTYQFMGFQHHSLRQALGGNHRTPLDRPTSILHISFGTFHWVAEMAAEFPGAHVVGFDLEPPDNVAAIAAPQGTLAANVSIVEGDATKGLPFPEGAFDYVHMRLLFNSLPVAYWPAVIAELARVVQPGGWVECLEPGEAVFDPGPAYAKGGAWLAELLRQRGMDPNLGPKLKALLEGAGLQHVVEDIVVTFSNVQMKRERRLWQAQNIGIFERLFRDPILEAGIVTVAEFENVMEAMRREFEAGQYANSDRVYVVYGQRPS